MIANNFALTTLSHNPEYFEEVIKLIEEEFHYSESLHFEKDFAPLVDPMNFEHCYLYIDKETNMVAAHLAVCERILIKGDFEIKAALIGGIATHKKFKRNNLFRNLMNHALREHEDRVAIFVLWSDLENLYEKFSFFRAGGLIETGTRNFSSGERPVGYEKTKFSSLNDKDFNSLVSLYSQFNEKYFFTLKREEKDWSIIREMDSIDLFIKKNVGGEIEKYFCVNKGRDLTNIIHEVACKNEKALHVLLRELECYKVWLPETEAERFSKSEIFYTAFLRPGSIVMFNSFLKAITKGDLKILKLENELLLFEFRGKSFEATIKDFLQYLFGPRPLEEFAPYKLSLYIAGADSI